MPHLPQGKVSLCAVSAQYPHIVQALKGQGIGVIEVPPNPNLPAPVAYHADMNLLHFGGETIIVANEQASVNSILRAHGFVVLEQGGLGQRYPKDVALNALLLGGRMFGHSEDACSKVVAFAAKREIHFIPVKQGYAKCAAAVVSEHAIITADPSIAKAAQNVGISVLQIAPGEVLLEGYDTGFLGGACFKADHRTLVFTGDVSRHSCYPQIKAFVAEHQVALEVLSLQELIDVGSVLPLKEQ